MDTIGFRMEALVRLGSCNYIYIYKTLHTLHKALVYQGVTWRQMRFIQKESYIDQIHN